jgi:hypothetical protein
MRQLLSLSLCVFLSLWALSGVGAARVTLQNPGYNDVHRRGVEAAI